MEIKARIFQNNRYSPEPVVVLLLSDTKFNRLAELRSVGRTTGPEKLLKYVQKLKIHNCGV